MATPIKLHQGFNEHVVENLEWLLDKAKKGEITQVVALYQMGFDFSIMNTGSDNVPEVIGWLEIIKRRQLVII